MDKFVLIQQAKKESNFKLFQIVSVDNGLSVLPIGFSGLDTDYPEFNRFVQKKGHDLLFHSNNLVRDGVPLDIVAASQKVFKDTKV